MRVSIDYVYAVCLYLAHGMHKVVSHLARGAWENGAFIITPTLSRVQGERFEKESRLVVISRPL
jgi:hypothetical protein